MKIRISRRGDLKEENNVESVIFFLLFLYLIVITFLKHISEYLVMTSCVIHSNEGKFI